jgi:polyhydroxyalkanoate synthesis repressor PhaR
MDKKSQILIKKYSNRRLYDTSTSSYINLSDVCKLVKNNEAFVIVDATSNKDITSAILVQIILDYETKGYELLPVDFLKHIIRFYDASSKDLATHFLENSELFFSKYKEAAELFNKSLINNLDGSNMLAEINNLTQKNMDFFFKTMAKTMQPKEEEKSPSEDATV